MKFMTTYVQFIRENVHFKIVPHMETNSVQGYKKIKEGNVDVKHWSYEDQRAKSSEKCMQSGYERKWNPESILLAKRKTMQRGRLGTKENQP